MLLHYFLQADGRLVKLSLFSTALDKSPLTSIYFTTFEKEREVRSPLPTQSKFLVFGKFHKTNAKHNFCSSDGRLVKPLLFSTLLNKSPLTSIYFTTFEKKSQVSPTHTIKFFGFWYI